MLTAPNHDTENLKMSDLKGIEKVKLEKLFGMGSGYVLNFSDRTFQGFILDTVGINVFSEEYGQCSKANRLRIFWSRENNYNTAKLTKALIDCWKENREDPSAEETRIYEACLKIADRLLRENPVENIDVIQADGKDFNLLAESIREAIEKNKPEAALDRLHTFVVKYVRQLCDKHTITYDKDEALHSIFGKYVKFLKANQLLESEMSERILKSSISILDAFNDVRNNRSFAHDNEILNYQESIFIFNNITNAIKFIESIEEKSDKENKQPLSANSENELPF